MIVVPIWILNSESLTDEEISIYWESLTTEERIQEIRNLDNIEAATPEIILPEYGAIVDADGDLIIFPLSEIMKIKIDYLEYEVELQSYKIKDFIIIQDNGLKWVLPPILGISWGILAGVLKAEKEFGAYVLYAGIGAASGLIISFLL